MTLNSIRTRILVPAVIFSAVLLGGFGYLMNLNQSTLMQEMLQSKGNAMADYMAKTSEFYYVNYDLGALDSFAKQVVKAPDVSYAVFYDESREPVSENTAPESRDNLLVFERTISVDDTVMGYLHLGYSTQRLSEQALSNFWLTGGAVALMVAVMALGLYFIVDTIIRQLKEFGARMEDIAQGEGDLTRAMSGHYSGEIAGIAEAFNGFISTLRATVAEVADAVGEVTDTAQRAGTTAATNSRHITRQSEVTNNLVSAIAELNTSVEHVARSAAEAAAAASEADREAVGGRAIIEQTAARVGDLAGTMSEASEVSRSLAGETDNIGAVLDVIRGIAEQTNLLALNAAIEAARAGESGRGFAVVADEVRTLAQRTQDSTAQIQQIIESLQEEAQKAVAVMDRGTSIAQNVVETSAKSGDSLRQITGAVSRISEMNQEISSATEQQRHVAENINTNVESIAGMAGESTGSSEAIESDCRQIETSASRLRSLVQHFKY